MLLDRLGDRAVQRDLLVGEEVVEHGLTQERVTEAVAAAVLVGEEDTGIDGGARRGPRPVGTEPGPAHEPRARRAGAAHRGGVDEVAGVGIKGVEAHEHQVAQRRRDAVPVERGDQLLDEEGVAVGVVSDPVDVGGARLAAEQEGRDLGGRVRGEALERDAPVAEPGELGEELALVGGVLGPVGHDQEDRGAAQVAGDVAQELTAGGVDPVHVVDDEDELALAGDVGEERDDRLEEKVLTTVFVGGHRPRSPELGDQAGELRAEGLGEVVAGDRVRPAEQPPERVGPGRVRHALDAAAPGEPGLVGAGAELVEETGLADARPRR